MSSDSSNRENVFKYNMSFYYQSTIIYFVVFALYLIIRGEFVEDSFVLVTKDPILYFLALIVVFSLIVLLYYLFLNKHIEISESGIAFIDRFKERRFGKEQIIRVKFFRERRTSKPKRLRIVRIKIEDRMRPIMFRISDYDKEDDLYNKLMELKSIVENK
ncbi:hypothetical protein LJE86_09940 [bacterium BMS3Abin03]|jgi:hypothetical protein|nr:hypothetical protein [bacterium BMS3Abin03]MCG6958984.1 hypothetical protein [bacterium BMS3Abin03]